MGCRPDGHFHFIDNPVNLFEKMFQWAVARMVTFTHRISRKQRYKRVSVGCRPDGHFHPHRGMQLKPLSSFSGLSPGWSLWFQKYMMLATHPATGGFLRFEHCRTRPCGIAQSGMSPGWSLWFQKYMMLATHPATGGFLRFEHCRTRPFGIVQNGMSPG